MKLNRRTLLVGATIATSSLGARASAVTPEDIFPIVETAQGKIRGIRAGRVNIFRGVRYGADTSGRNRFMPPRPPPNFSGVRDASDFGQYAPQGPASRERAHSGLIFFDVQPGGMGEDCLVANIWTPSLDANAKLPVMLHIHGGGYYGGSGNSLGYDGEELARFANSVVITVNHRIGSFGFCNLSDWGEEFAHSGGVGMMDLVQALQWIRENAAAFGGDPSRVLVFGQSGGGAKTSVLLSMPSAKGLFQRAGVMSGATVRIPTQEEAQKGAAAYLKLLGVSKGDVRKLQSLPFQTLLAAQLTLEGDARAVGEVPRAFSPSVDGSVLPGQPFDAAALALSASVPLIISTVLDERAYRMTNYDLDEAGLRTFIARRVGEIRADTVLAMYRRESPRATPFVLQARFDTDEQFRKSAIIASERVAQRGGAPVWNYLWRSPSPAYEGRSGAVHGVDVGPSFHDTRGGLNDSSLESQLLADQLASAWASFAAKGDPNNALMPEWPAYTLPRRSTMVFDRETRVEEDPRRPFREFWEKEPPKAG